MGRGSLQLSAHEDSGVSREYSKVLLAIVDVLIKGNGAWGFSRSTLLGQQMGFDSLLEI
jgi:hypothetical protein